MKRILMLTFVLLAATLPFSTGAKAWGEYGHLTVCDLAYRNLTDTSQEKLKAIFQVESGGITVKNRDGFELRHYTSFNVGCLEEDAIPRKHPEDHFINVTRDTTAISNGTCPGSGACILSGIKRDLDILKDEGRSNEDRVFALMAVGHWIGDIHQPLHISFADDRGGNRIEAKLKGKCGSSKYRVKELHGLWDNCLLEAGLFERVRKRADFKPTWGKRTITYRAVDTLLINTTLTEEKAIVGDDPWVWADQSFQIATRPAVLYCTKVGNACQYSADTPEFVDGAEMRLQSIDQSYLQSFERLAEERIKLAGFRLAHLVNLALDPVYTEPVQNSTQQP
jgi:hypothetical protein